MRSGRQKINHMYNQIDHSTIRCNIHQDSFAAISAIKLKINQGASVVIKAKYAEELSDQVTCLMDCPKYQEQAQDCVNCQLIAGLHKKVATLIIKAKSLSI